MKGALFAVQHPLRRVSELLQREDGFVIAVLSCLHEKLTLGFAEAVGDQVRCVYCEPKMMPVER